MWWWARRTVGDRAGDCRRRGRADGASGAHPSQPHHRRAQRRHHLASPSPARASNGCHPTRRPRSCRRAGRLRRHVYGLSDGGGGCACAFGSSRHGPRCEHHRSNRTQRAAGSHGRPRSNFGWAQEQQFVVDASETIEAATLRVARLVANRTDVVTPPTSKDPVTLLQIHDVSWRGVQRALIDGHSRVCDRPENSASVHRWDGASARIGM